MPNILIGYNGRFEPLSYDELLKPIAYATEQQNAYEAAYEKIGDTADSIASQLNEGDVNSLAIYNDYSKKLNDARDQLLEKGFKDPNARKALQDVRKEFNNGMLKVGSAVEQRNKDLAARNKMLLEHPNMAVSPIGNVDSYLAGTNKPLQSVDLNVQYNKAVAAGKGITSRMWHDPEFRNGMMLIRHGLASPNEVMDMLSNSVLTDENGNPVTDEYGNLQSKYPEFQTAIRSLLMSSGQENLSDADSDRVTSTIMDGLIAGMIYDEKRSGIPSSGRSGGSGSYSGSRISPDVSPTSPSKFPITTRQSNAKNETQKDINKTVNKTERHFDNRYKNNMITVNNPSANATSGQPVSISTSFVDNNGRIKYWGDFKNDALVQWEKHNPKPKRNDFDKENGYKTYSNFVNNWEKNRSTFVRNLTKAYSEFENEISNIGLRKGEKFSQNILKNALENTSERGTGVFTRMIATQWNTKTIKENVLPYLKKTKNGKNYTVYQLKGANKNGEIALEEVEIPVNTFDGDGMILKASYNPTQHDKHGNHLILVEGTGGLKFYIRAADLNDQLENEISDMDYAFSNWRNPKINIDYNTLYDMYNMTNSEFESSKKFTDEQKEYYRQRLMENDISNRAHNVHNLLFDVATKNFTNSESLND